MECVIKNEESGRYLAAINFGCHHVEPLLWVPKGSYRIIRFENEEEAEATIAFIGDVMDWELAECLVIEKGDLQMATL